eukprot:TRINITY_DN2118_c0_g1_i17.p1 TRINITY_DN2118_c0_g1~~TRINITY_DN2118_c0_g1_i17.p1  ORF type:complete len:487 (+),score=64.34 TRINITY_DN2118_c0_g1_i17:92-1552(+)
MVVQVVRSLSKRCDFPLQPGTAVLLLTMYIGVVILFTSSLLLGFSQLYPVFVSEGLFHNLCTIGNHTNKGSVLVTGPSDHFSNFSLNTTCLAQELGFTELFTYGTICGFFTQAAGGFLLDIVGPKISITCASTGLLLAFLLLSYSDGQYYLPCFCVIGGSSGLVFNSSIEIASFFGQYSALCMTILEACYSAGAVIFFVFRKVYFSKLASLQTIYFSYSMMVAFFLWTQIFLWPWEKFSELSKQIYVVDDEKVNEDKGDNVEEDKLFVKDQEAEWSFHTYLKGLLKNIFTFDFLYLVVLVSALIFQGTFFMSTFHQQLMIITLGNSAQVLHYSDILGILLPTLGIVVAPFGLFVHRFGVEMSISLLLSLVLGDLLCAISGLVSLVLLRFVLVSIWISYCFAVWIVFIEKKFGYAFYGGLFSVVGTSSAILLFANGALINFATSRGWNGFFVVYLFQIILVCLLFLYPIAALVRFLHEKYFSKKENS